MRSVATRFLLPVALLGLVFTAFDLYCAYSDTQKHITELTSQQAALALEFDLAIRGYVAEEIRPAMQEKVGPDEFAPETMSTSFVARSIFEKVRNEFPDYVIKFSSDNPRNPANQAGPAEQEMIEYFNDNPEVDRWSGKIKLEGAEYLAYFSARRMKEKCLRCHGCPEDAPASLLKRYGTTAGFHRPVGEVIALDTIAIPLEKSQAAMVSDVAKHTLVMALGLALFFAGIILLFRQVVARRLAVISKHFTRIATQPESASITPVEVRGHDEISALASSFNALAKRIRAVHASLEERVAQRTEQLAKGNQNLRQEIAERRQAEEELRESRGCLQTILDTVQAGIVVIEVESHTIVDANPAALEMIGAPREKVVGRVCHKYICPAEVGRCPISDLGQEVDNSERVLLKANGRSVPILKTVTPLMLNGRKHLLDSFVDISQLKRAEDGLRESEERHRAITETAQDAIITADADGNIHFWNAAAAKIFGFTASEAVGKNMMELIVPPRYHAAKRKGLAEFARTGRGAAIGQTLELAALRKDGTEFPIEISVSGYRDQDGFIAVALVRDISQRKQAEDALCESEEKFRTISASAQDAIIMMDGDGTISFWNKAAQSIFGYTPEEAIGTNVHAFLAREWFHEAHFRAFPRFQETGQGAAVGKTLELAAVRSNGEEFPSELSLSAVCIRGQWHAIGIVRDITTRKHAEAERLRALELEQERNHLRDAVQTLERTLGIIGHELRTPLAGVRAMAEFLLHEETRESQEAETFLGPIKDEVVRMAGMVNDLLEVARLNSGTARWNWSEVPMVQACEAAMNTVRPLVDQAKVTLTLQVNPPDLTMNGDQNAIRRLVLNLLNNARKHTPEGSISVRARKVHPDNQDWVQFEVSDTGKGISPEVAGRLGVAFALNSGVVGENHVQGSGLGLAICKGIVAAHGGTISVRTAPGEGTTVTILLRRDLTEPASSNEEDHILCEVL